jgi:hypothetical protein
MGALRRHMGNPEIWRMPTYRVLPGAIVPVRCRLFPTLDKFLCCGLWIGVEPHTTARFSNAAFGLNGFNDRLVLICTAVRGTG